MAYAEVSDIEARWRSLSPSEQDQAGVLIEDASAKLAALVEVDDEDKQQAKLLRTVCCSMVIRAMSASMAASIGATSMSMTAGSYTQSMQYSNPVGDMYLTRMEKKLLGIGGARVGWAPLGGSDV